jgi:GTP diphosphokinase / guanosine-3',5'-bis(diphosphate) 3'-diphosphatase
MLYHLAKCCMPVPGEPIVAVVTRSRGVMVHREECTNLDQANPERRMAVSWDAGDTGYGKKTTHSVTLEIHVMDRVGVFKDVLAQIADSNTNLTNARIKRFQADQTVVIEVTADIENLGHLERVKTAIKKLDDVLTVKRLDFRPSN